MVGVLNMLRLLLPINRDRNDVSEQSSAYDQAQGTR
jgi:hypothetical protein